MNIDRIGVSMDAGAVTPGGPVETYPEKDVVVHAVTRVTGYDFGREPAYRHPLTRVHGGHCGQGGQAYGQCCHSGPQWLS